MKETLNFSNFGAYKNSSKIYFYFISKHNNYDDQKDASLFALVKFDYATVIQTYYTFKLAYNFIFLK